MLFIQVMVFLPNTKYLILFLEFYFAGKKIYLCSINPEVCFSFVHVIAVTDEFRLYCENNFPLEGNLCLPTEHDLVEVSSSSSESSSSKSSSQKLNKIKKNIFKKVNSALRRFISSKI